MRPLPYQNRSPECAEEATRPMTDTSGIARPGQPQHRVIDQCDTCGHDRVEMVVGGKFVVATCPTDPDHCEVVREYDGPMDFTEDDRWWTLHGGRAQ